MEENAFEIALQSTTYSQNTPESYFEDENNKISQIDILQLTTPPTEEFLTMEEAKMEIRLREIDNILSTL